MQTRKHSFLESCSNIAIKYPIAILSQILIFPLFDINIPLSDNLLIGIYFTVISMATSYILRRYFNRKTIKGLNVIFVDDLEDSKPLTQKEKDAVMTWWKILKLKSSNRP